MAATFGSGAMTNSIGEMDDADLFFVLGSNTTEQHPLVAARIIQAVQRGARLIVADPRKTQIASLAHVHLRHAVGSDVALVNGLMNIILQNGWEDRAFINGRTENFQALESVVSEYDEERVSSITGLSKKSIVEAAALYAQSPKAMIVYAMGITQHVAGTDNVKSLANLAMVTGHVGRPSSGVNPLRGQNNVQGACDMGALPS
ncbi:MAG TPA: formate dehydrogenase subunit alpha, partial [Desulfobacteraceae bacterium]|nr:formate dehydrogenase subunit alpha [Desulfobacteraceae bacterium]